MAIVQIMRLQSKTSCAIRFNDRFQHDCIYNMHISSHKLIAWWRYDTPYALCNRVELIRCWGKPSSLMRLTITSPMNGHMYTYVWYIFTYKFDALLHVYQIHHSPTCKIRYKTWESHIVWRFAFHQVCQKALQARVVSWWVRFLDVPLVGGSWDVIERKPVDTWSWWTLVALVVVLFTPD